MSLTCSVEEVDGRLMVPLHELMTALDMAYHPQLHFEAHPLDFLVERFGVTEEQWAAWRRWESAR